MTGSLNFLLIIFKTSYYFNKGIFVVVLWEFVDDKNQKFVIGKRVKGICKLSEILL